jgi:hypothetical protein
LTRGLPAHVRKAAFSIAVSLLTSSPALAAWDGNSGGTIGGQSLNLSAGNRINVTTLTQSLDVFATTDTIAANDNVTITGSQVIAGGGGNVAITGNNVTINAAQNTSSETQTYKQS